MNKEKEHLKIEDWLWSSSFSQKFHIVFAIESKGRASHLCKPQRGFHPEKSDVCKRYSIEVDINQYYDKQCGEERRKTRKNRLLTRSG